MRRVDQRIAAGQILLAHPVFQLLANDAALGMKEDEAGARKLLNRDEVKLFAELAMVALFRLFNAGQEFVLPLF